MTFKFLSPASTATLLLIFVLGVVPAQRAEATIINYTFTGFTGLAGSIDLGAGAVSIAAGTAYTVTGMTLSDVDSFGPLTLGLYAAMSTYTFAGIAGAFVTDATTNENFGLDCGSATLIGCAFLGDSPLTDISSGQH